MMDNDSFFLFSDSNFQVCAYVNLRSIRVCYEYKQINTNSEWSIVTRLPGKIKIIYVKDCKIWVTYNFKEVNCNKDQGIP